MLNNLTLAELFVRNMRQLGRKIRLADPEQSFGSTDFGNVSQLVPGIHPSVAIAPPGDIVIHSPQFAEAAASEAAVKGLLDAAKALAMTVTDLVSDADLMGKVAAEFYRSQPGNRPGAAGGE